MSDVSRVEPRCLVVMCGTGTEVGKTWLTARLVEALRREQATVNVRKPLQSYEPDSGDPTDADVLAAASGEPVHNVCTQQCSYPVAMAPPMAAAELGRRIPTLAEIVSTLRWTEGVQYGFVETVGGVRSPLCANGDSRDLVRALSPDVVVLVADAGLGAVDAVRTAVDSLAPCTPLVFLNRYDSTDPLHRRNRDWLADRDGVDVSIGLEELVVHLGCTRPRS